MTVCIALSDEKTDDTKIRMNKVVRKNLGVQLGDIVTVELIADGVPFGKAHVLPFEDTMHSTPGNLLETYLKPYFKDNYRPVHKGDTFIVGKGFRPVEFKVMEIDPPGQDYCIVAPETVLVCDGDPIKRVLEGTRLMVEAHGDDDDTDKMLDFVVTLSPAKMDG